MDMIKRFKPIDVETIVPPELEIGVYSNYAIISHTPYEFTIIFTQTIIPVTKEECDKKIMKTKVVAKVVVTPEIMNNLIRALQSNYQKYKNYKEEHIQQNEHN